jgi:hypothetical protein
MFGRVGFNPRRSGILYYLRVKNPHGDPVYKIGVTNYTVRTRYPEYWDRITIIQTWFFWDGYKALAREQEILRECCSFRYHGPAVIGSGYSELFSCDVLKLDSFNN